jgi:hypothetical protein
MLYVASEPFCFPMSAFTKIFWKNIPKGKDENPVTTLIGLDECFSTSGTCALKGMQETSGETGTQVQCLNFCSCSLFAQS